MNAIKSVVMGSLCTLALGGSSAFGRTINVPGDYATVAEAVANAEKDDIIQLVDDTHLLTGTLVVDVDVTIRGSSYEKCILKQTTAKVTVVTLNSPNAKLENLTVTGASGNPYYMHGAGVQIASNGGNVSGCMISNNCFTGVVDYGGGICVEGPSVIENSRIVKNQAGGMNHGSYGGGIYLGADAQVIVDNCLIADNTCDGNGGGIDAQFSQKQNAIVRNCTIANNWSYNAGGGVYVYNTTSLYMYNCVIAANRVDNDSGDGNSGADSVAVNSAMNSSGWLRNCIVGGHAMGAAGESDDTHGYPNWSLDNAAGRNRVQNCCWIGSDDLGSPCAVAAKVAFVNEAEGDFRLRIASSCRDAGVATNWQPGIGDLDGNPRVFHKGKIDIGCYECQEVMGLQMLVR